MILIKKNITPEARLAIDELLKANGKKAHFKQLGGKTESEKDTKYSLSNKEKIQASLLKEQGGICAYCMQRIFTAEKIEHWTAQKTLIQNPNETLNYDIMLAVCSGEIDTGGIKNNKPIFLHHCDTLRGEITGTSKNEDDDKLTINPTDETLIKYIKYSKLGQIYFQSGDDTLDKLVNDDIIRKLALDIMPNDKEDGLPHSDANRYFLRLNRRYAYKQAETLCKAYRIRFKTDFPRIIAKYIKETWEERDKDGNLNPYCGIVLYFKEKLCRPTY